MTAPTLHPRHGPIAQLLITWSPLSLILVAYAVADWISSPIDPTDPSAYANRLGLGLHVLGPARMDHAVFGVIPSSWLQARLHDGHPQWYDAVAALVYVTHFVAIPLVSAVTWFALREHFRRWLRALLAFTVLGIGGYVVYPAAPPWLAARDGVIPPVDRLSNLGWEWLHLPVGRLVELGQAGGNPVAAMPSLHAGAALLVTLYLWPLVRRPARAALTVWVLLMGLTLVYTGEHYVVDVVTGWVVAAAAIGAAGWWARSHEAISSAGSGRESR